MKQINIKSRHLTGAEISWFAPICNGDTEFMGEMNNQYQSTWENASSILLTADRLGYKNILCPSSYQAGQDTMSFVSAVAPLTKNTNLLAAVRCGEIHPHAGLSDCDPGPFLKGKEIRERTLDAQSYEVSRQAEMRYIADQKGYAEPNLWTGIGRAPSGCGAALVGTPDQIIAKIQRYMDMGIRAFIFSGYPHLKECKLFAEMVLPRLKTLSLPVELGRIPKETPATPIKKT